MNERAVIVERLHKKEAEIQSLEEKLRAAKIYLQALQDILGALETSGVNPNNDAVLRTGSSVALAREAIIRAGKPLYISDLLSALGKGVTKEGRASLTSSLAAYVRRGEIFTRPAPNTFGLLELGHTPQPSSEEPPLGFGWQEEPQDADTKIPV